MYSAVFEFVFKNLWQIVILLTILNVYINHLKIRSKFTDKPLVLATADRLNRGFAVFGSLPWILMGIGIMTGRVEGVADFFGAARGIPFVRFWYLFMGGVFALGTVWVFFGRGAESFAEVGVQLSPRFTPRIVKWAWVGIVAWNLALGSGMYFDALGVGPKMEAKIEARTEGKPDLAPE